MQARETWIRRAIASHLAIGVLAVASSASAASQSSQQQTCLNALTKSGSDVIKFHGKAALKCLAHAADRDSDRLGDDGETLTAQACLTNDVGSKVAKKTQRTIDTDADRCQGEAAPEFAHPGAAAINASASATALALVEALFGPDLDVSVVSSAIDDDGAQCQAEVLRGAQRIVADMWRVGRDAVKRGLKGSDRSAGISPDTPADSAANLQGEVLAKSLDDGKGKIAGAVDRLASRAQVRCGAAQTPLAMMFPGACASAADVSQLAACASDVARGLYFTSVAGLQGTEVECDLTDDGAHDNSCESAAQRQHLLERTAYGPDTYTIARLQTLGLNGYIDEQLDPNAIDDSSVDGIIAATYPSQLLNVVEVRDCYPQNGSSACPPGYDGGDKNDVWRDMEESELYRATASRRQLEAILVDFWFNHFSVTGSVGQQKWNTPSYLRDSIRPWVLGNFTESVLRMARGPAMLDYLDQRLNQIGNPPGTGYNENFSRELLELHTMGVTAPYTENDVKELARALTGWRDEWNNVGAFDPDYPGFRYDDTRHDDLGAKIVLGQLIDFSADGEREGLEAVTLAAQHASTASFICTKLVRRFVGEAPPFALVDRCTATFLVTTDAADQLRQLMELLLKSREFQLFPEYRRNKVKRPVMLVPSLLRTVGANPDPGVANYTYWRRQAANLGERIRNADPPTGYPDDSLVWASPGGLVQRFNLVESACQLYGSSLGASGSGTSAQVVDSVIGVLFPLDGVSSETRTAAIAYLDSISAGSLQKIEQACAFLLSSREFLLH